MKQSYVKTIKQFSNSTIIYFLFFIALASSLLIYYLLSIISINAQEPPNQSALGVSPAIMEEVLTPGKVLESKVTITNVTNFPLPIKGTVKNFLTDFVIPDKDRGIFDASAWFKLEPADFILQPKENKEIKIIIAPPQNAEPGGHYATIYFQPLIPREVLSPQTTYLAARVGVLSLLIMKGDIVEKASLGNLSVLSSKKIFKTVNFQESGRIKMEISFKNEGNVHLMPAGEVEIFNSSGKLLQKLPFPENLILPKTEKIYSLDWPIKKIFGKFTLNVNFSYGSEQIKVKSEKISVIIFPFIPVLGITILLTFIIICLTIIRRRIVLALKILFGKDEAHYQK